MTREPALIIGVLASIILIVAQQALSTGVVASDGSVRLLNLIIGVTPLLSAAIIRLFVTPAVKPGL